MLIQVSDTGSGMSLETQSHMFEPFFSTKEMNVGLGLTAVYGIVKQSAGQVDVVSQPGQGTVVRVTLPLYRTGPVTGPLNPGQRFSQRPGNDSAGGTE